MFNNKTIWFVKQSKPNCIASMWQWHKDILNIQCQAFILANNSGLRGLLSLSHVGSIAAHNYNSYTQVCCACLKYITDPSQCRGSLYSNIIKGCRAEYYTNIENISARGTDHTMRITMDIEHYAYSVIYHAITPLASAELHEVRYSCILYICILSISTPFTRAASYIKSVCVIDIDFRFGLQHLLQFNRCHHTAVTRVNVH